MSAAGASWWHTGLGLVDRWEMSPVPTRPLCSCSTSDFVSSRILCQGKVLQLFLFLMTLHPVQLREICHSRTRFLASKKEPSVHLDGFQVRSNTCTSFSACMISFPVHQTPSFVTQEGDQSRVSLRPIPHFHKFNEVLKGGSFTAQCFLFSVQKSKRMQ